MLAPEFEASGQALWDGYSADLTPGQHVLLTEACRIVDRLDRLHEWLTSERPWLTLGTLSGESVLVIDKALAEARQQAVALKSILSTLGVGQIEQSEGTVDFLDSIADELAPKRQGRRSGS